MGTVIEARGVSVLVPLPNRKPLLVVDDATIALESGVSYAISGKSGSGKTSLLSVLGLLNTAFTGSLTFRGRDVAAMSDRELSWLRARRLGFVFQSYSLVPHLNALANVMLPCVHVGARRPAALRLAKRSLAAVGLADRLDALPVQLSGGEQQRVAIARAIVNSPDVVMADEPTGALDTDTAADVMNLLVGQVADLGISLVIVTHDEEIAQLCTRRYVMGHGRLRAVGPGPERGAADE